MVSIAPNAYQVNHVQDRSCRPRARWQIRRMLTLVDLLANCRQAQTAHEITYLLNERLGTTYCQRTIERDLELLESENVVSCETLEMFRPYSPTGVRTWRLPCRENETLQAVAMHHVDASSQAEGLYALCLFDDQLGWYRAPNEPRSLLAWQDTLYCLDGVATLVPVGDAERFVARPVPGPEYNRPSRSGVAESVCGWLGNVIDRNPPADPIDFGMLARALFRYSVAAFEGAPWQSDDELAYTLAEAEDFFQCGFTGEAVGGPFFNALGVTREAWQDWETKLPELERFA